MNARRRAMLRKASVKRLLRKKYSQSGKSSLYHDRLIKALVPGWRVSQAGHLYYEDRRNRSDKSQKLRL